MNIYVVFQRIGYKKHPSIKNRLIVDEKVANIVRKIFNMYANGHGTVEIANYLNNNKYLSPTGYRKTRKIQDENKTNYDWNEVTLCNMLKNEVYIGNTIQNKKTVVSYKVKKIRTVEKENQIRVNNTHEPIINKYVFEKVQCIINKRGTNAKLKHDYLFRGLLYCYHCKRKLQIVRKKNIKRNAKDHPYIVCSDYKKRGCYAQSMNYDKFENYMIYNIRKMCQVYVDKEFLYKVYEKYQNKTSDKKEVFKKKIEKITKAILDINNSLDKMYMDKLNNVIYQEDYKRFAQKLNFEKAKLKEQKQELEKKLIESEEENKTKEEIEGWIEKFLRLEKIHKIYLYRLINKIEIDKDKNIYIYFNFSKLDKFIKRGEGNLCQKLSYMLNQY